MRSDDVAFGRRRADEREMERRRRESVRGRESEGFGFLAMVI